VTSTNRHLVTSRIRTVAESRKASRHAPVLVRGARRDPKSWSRREAGRCAPFSWRSKSSLPRPRG
jgi:hypothetical protein